MTALGAGLGMKPYAVLIPVNAFVATEQAHTTPVARCDCGVYGCRETTSRSLAPRTRSAGSDGKRSR
jgi:hypothetical protein